MASTRRQFLRRATAIGGVALAGSADAVAGDQNASPPPPNAFDYKRNWGRWGSDDQMGALNLITASKRVSAANLVKTGRVVSLSRVFTPPQHYIRINADRGSAMDYYGFEYHGVTVTHLDALSHMWDRNGMWNGRDPSREIDTSGARFGDITAFGNGIVTRGVMLDVPRHRGTSHVTHSDPVTGAELEAIAKSRNVSIGSGDALLVHCGRDAFVRAGNTYGGATEARPGLHVSCARFIRDRDVSVLVWDMHDALPDPDGHLRPGHGVLFSYGVPLVDNALLEPLAQACAEENRDDFMFMALPLKVARGTGSPVNPIALF
jgi:kynurenine formamidase